MSSTTPVLLTTKLPRPHAMPSAVITMSEISDVVMKLNTLDTIKYLAEGRSESGLKTITEENSHN